MNWRQIARWGVAAIGIGCAIAIFAYGRKRPAPPARPAELQKIDPTIQLQGGAGQTFYYRTGRSNITVTFAKTSAYADGRAHFEQVVIEGLEESRFVVRAGAMDTSAPTEGGEQPKQLNLLGGVKLKTDDGLELSSDTATWDEAANKLTMPGLVTFQKGRITGSGNGATYDQEHDAFYLLSKAQAHVNPDAAGGNGADLSSSNMALFRGQHIVELNENARIVGETQTMTGRKATLSFTEDETAMKYVDLDGAAKVTPNPPKPPAKGATSRPGMDADKITMSFYEDGATLKHATLTGKGVLTLSGDAPRTVKGSLIDLTTAPDGQTLTGLKATDRVSVVIAPTTTTKGRTITSSSLVATGDAKKGLTSARFEGSPRFEESPEKPARGGGAPPSGQTSRTGTSVVIVLALGGQIDAIERADFLQNAVFRDGDTTGNADIAQYEEASGKLHLMPNQREPRRLSSVKTPNMTVEASTIDVETETDNLTAKGSVTTQSAATSAGQSKPGALFGGTEPIVGTADALSYTKASGLAIYTGTANAQARLKQGESEIYADRIEYSDNDRNLNGRGKVTSVWWLEAANDDATAAKNKTLKRQRVRADTMTYDDAARVATYTGEPVNVTTTDSVVEGRTVTFYLAETERALKSMRAVTLAWAKLSGDYEAGGHVIVYEAATDLYTLDGLAEKETAKVKTTDTSGAKPTCSLYEGMKLQLNRQTGQVSIPGKGLAPRNNEVTPCTLSLKRSK